MKGADLDMLAPYLLGTWNLPCREEGRHRVRTWAVWAGAGDLGSRQPYKAIALRSEWNGSSRILFKDCSEFLRA